MKKDLKDKNAEMEVQNEELQEQSEELQTTAEELRKQAEELEEQKRQVEEADRLKSEFLSNMSHELRTPLNSVLALSQLMLARGPGKEPGKDAEHLELIERSGKELLALINDILDLSKIESGQVELEVSKFDPGGTLTGVVDSLRSLAEEKGIKFEAVFGEVPRISSDETRVRQILLNLVGNAIKFTSSGSVTVKLALVGGQVSFKVTDTGIGISEADLAHIFDEFRQADGSTTRRYGGTGLGLAICRKLTAILGGTLTARSEPGQGSTFIASFPLVLEQGASQEFPITPAKPARSVRRRPAKAGGGRSPCVLVIEDNEAATLQVRSLLEDGGYRVLTAKDGAEAFKTLAESLPDLIILDLMMPGINGFEVLERLRSEERTELVPVIVLTAKELSREEHARLKRNEIDELVQKGGLNREELLARVRDILDPPPPPASRDPQQKKSSPGAPRLAKIALIVEDNPASMAVTRAILEEVGCAFVTAENGAAAVAVAKKSRPGLILMDIQLPGMNGMEAARRIKADPDLAGVRIVALTAKAMKGDRKTILASGIDAYISKPIDPELLKTELKAFLKRS